MNNDCIHRQRHTNTSNKTLPTKEMYPAKKLIETVTFKRYNVIECYCH